MESTEITTETENVISDEQPVGENPTEAPILMDEEDAVQSPSALFELCEVYPEITCENADDLCNIERYRELRALGLSVEEAYRATSKRKVASDSRSHLSVSVGGGGVPSSHGISEPELRSARDIFSGMSDSEIRRLYKRVTA